MPAEPCDLWTHNMRCHRCGAPPDDLRRLTRRMGKPARQCSITDTGVEFWETDCLACGFAYGWRVVRTPSLEVLLCDERPLGRPAKKQVGPSFPGIAEAEVRGEFRKPGDRGRSPQSL
jgi:hypothetical protein